MKTLIAHLNKIEEMFIGYALLLIAFVTCIQVLFRYAFGISFDWVEEGSRYMTVLITFVGAGMCVRHGSHFAMDAMVNTLPLRGKYLCQALAMFVSALTVGVVCYFGWVQVAKIFKFGATTPVLRLPMYVPYLPIAIFSGLMACRFFLQGCLRVRDLTTNNVPRGRTGGHLC
jgi:C4-dicarboxylate transporter DctQ subunit